jgi:ABC-2 type transport system ATP-binding protein
MDEAEALCDRVAVVDQGRVIALGTPRELVASLKAEHIVEFAVQGGALPPPDMFRHLPGVQETRLEDGHLCLHVSEPAVVIPALLGELERRRLTLSRFTTHQATLEDVFVTLTGRHLRDE